MLRPKPFPRINLNRPNLCGSNAVEDVSIHNELSEVQVFAISRP